MSYGPARHELFEAAWRSGVPERWVLGLAALLTGTALVAGCPKGGTGDPGVVATLKQMEIVHGQIEIWARENRRAPTLEQGLEAVFSGQVPKDAWGHDLLYVVPGPDGWAFDLVSYGADGVAGGRKSGADIVWSTRSGR